MITNVIQFDADVAAIEPEADVNGPLVFRYQGKEFNGQKTSIVDKLAMADAGFEPGFDFSMEVRKKQFTDLNIIPPANNDTITISDTEYCIVGTTPDQFGIVNHYAVKQKS